MVADLDNIQAVPHLDTLLALLQRMTGLRISLVARVDSSSWTCCAVRDDAAFGLEVGSTLDVAATY